MGLNPKISGALIVLIAMGALLFRLPQLDLRPMHGDEANQAVKAGHLLETSRYEYDPHDHHGPTLYYLTLLPAWISGTHSFADTTEFTYRIVPVLFGVGLILLLLLLRDALGHGAAVWAAMFIAVSPAFVFYSRYYIQEMLLVFFTLAAITCAWRYKNNPSIAWAAVTGLSLSLMHATKETAILAYAAMAAGLISLWIRDSVARTQALAYFRAIPRNHWLAFILPAIAASILLYSAFFTHLRGPLDSILTYGNYLQRADGAGLHDKPWHYYLGLLTYVHRGPGPWWSEGLILILAAAALLTIAFRYFAKSAVPNFILFLTVYTFALTTVYAVIPYKTPWSMLSFYNGIILLAAVSMAAALKRIPSTPLKALFLIPILAATAHLGLQSYRANFVYPADPRNPYVYAHTSSAFLKLVQRVDDIAAIHPDPPSMLIKIYQPDRDYWPLPWYLRKYDHVGYWDTPPANPEADIIIAAPGLRDELSERLQGEYAKEMQGLRPSVLRHVYIKQSLWDAFMATRQ